MKGKNKEKKLIVSSAVVLCMAFAILFTVFSTKASGEPDKVVYEPQTYTKNGEFPTKEGYLFGGWYQEENEEHAVVSPEDRQRYWAKFVPENVLGIKAQVSNTILTDETETSAAIRFVTTLDSTQYKKIGFLVKKGTGEVTKAKVTNAVYEKLYQVTDQDGSLETVAPEKVEPTIFSPASKYFKTYTIRKVPDSAYNTDITVTPYWITLDGTTVVGTKSIKTVNLGRSWVYVDAEYGYFPVSDGKYDTLPEQVTYLGSENAPVVDYDNGGSKFATNVNTAYNNGNSGGPIKLLDDTSTYTGSGSSATWTGGTEFAYGLGVHPCNNREGYTDIDLTGLDVDTFYSAVAVTNSKTMNGVSFGVYGKANENDEWQLLLDFQTVKKGTAGEIKLNISAYSYLRLSVKQAEAYASLGSAWANACVYKAENEVYGTYNHPFTRLNDALNEIRLENGGKVIVKGSSTVTVPADFDWTKHTAIVKRQEKDCNIKLTGETANAGIDFSAMKELNIRDNVIFDNVKVKFYGTSLEDYGEVYANGNDFTIAATVNSENKFTTIFGGSKDADVTGDTNITLLAGRYKAVFGGGYNGGVTKSTNVTIENVDIYTPQGEYDSNKDEKNRVVGGSYNGGTIGEDTNIIIGAGFNANANLNNGSTLSHSELSAIFGGCYGIKKETEPEKGIVKGNTNITLKSDAKTNYIYGGGDRYSSVEGTCNVSLSGNCSAMSIWGGAYRGENKGTSVIMNGGTVEQIFGGNQNGMTGNTYVEITGGAITRRVYGGCYNNYNTSTQSWAETMHYVNGYATIVVKDSNALKFNMGITGIEDNSFCAGSRCNAGSDNEVGVLVFTDDIYKTVENKVGFKGLLAKATEANPYNYLIDATGGGDVKAGGKMLQMKPDTASAKGTLAFKQGNDVQVYFDMECSWPMINAGATSQREVKVDFYTSAMETSVFEASMDTTYYAQLEDAVDAANVRTDAPTVKVLKDAAVERVMYAEKGADFTVQGADNTPTITGDKGELDIFDVKADGNLTIENLKLIKGKNSIYSAGMVTVKNVESENAGNAGLTVWGSAIAEGLKITNATKQGVYVASGATADITNLTVKGTGMAAIRPAGTGKITINGGEIETTVAGAYGVYLDSACKVDLTDVTIKTTEANAINIRGTLNMTGGTVTTDNAEAIYTVENSELTLSGVTIERTASNGKALVSVREKSTVTMQGSSKIDGKKDAFTGRGVEVQGTFNLEGGTIANHKGAGATALVTGSNATNGCGVYVVAGGTFTMNDGSIEENENTTAGAAVAIDGADAEFKLQGGTIQKNKAVFGAVMVRNGAFNMREGMITQNTATTSGGGIAISQGTFTMYGGKISNNEAGSGGGIFINNKGSIVLAENSTGIIAENMATSTYGGGIDVNHANATFFMNGGTISGNSAKSGGGGVSIRACKSAVMNGGTIEENKGHLTEPTVAGTGSGGGIYLNTGVEFTMTGGNIVRNRGRNGGAIYVEPRKNNPTETDPLAATIYFAGGMIKDNVVINGSGEGIRCGNGTEARRGTVILQNGKVQTDIADGITNMTIKTETN